MTLLAVERMKLFSTRSPWWCISLALVLTVGMAAMMAWQWDGPMTLGMTQGGRQLGMMVMLVLAALSVTTEYRFGTIRATFLAVPNRIAALVAKAVVVAVLALVVGEVAAFGSWGLAGVLSPESDLALSGVDAWRQVAGGGLVYGLCAILAVGVGALVRQSAGAITLLLLWPLLVENLISLIPNIGPEIQKWMPFSSVSHFLAADVSGSDMPFGQWAALGYFAAVSVAVFALALFVTHRRDA
ncbi:hypothetical protein [Saccharopolyspora cebuensis]|uniref:ABC-2 type transport system permease protein n=1 Tax=Saccharopolyspora cebuensis TaxID=418759 RepID=A0ABV4CJ09_9PSEU